MKNRVRVRALYKRTFSHSGSAGLRYLVEHEDYDRGLLTTAWFIDFIDRWFNLASSRHLVAALSSKNSVAYSGAIVHLKEAVSVFADIKCGKTWKPWQAVPSGFSLRQ